MSRSLDKPADPFDDNLRLHYECASLKFAFQQQINTSYRHVEQQLFFSSNEMQKPHRKLSSPGPPLPIRADAAGTRDSAQQRASPRRASTTQKTEPPSPSTRRNTIILGPIYEPSSPSTSNLSPLVASRHSLGHSLSPTHGSAAIVDKITSHDAPSSPSCPHNPPSRTNITERRLSTPLEWELLSLLQQAAVADKAQRAKFDNYKKDQDASVQSLLKDKETLTSNLAHARAEVERLNNTLLHQPKPKESRPPQQDKALLRALDSLRQVQRERDTAEEEKQKAVRERDEMRRAKEKALADRSGAVSKKIELQARLAVLEKKGAPFKCPEFDALVKDRDEAKRSQAAVAEECERLREDLTKKAAAISFLEESILLLRAQFEEAKAKKEVAGTLGKECDDNTRLCASLKAVHVTQAFGASADSTKTTSSPSPGRKRSFGDDHVADPVPTESKDVALKKPRLAADVL